VPDERRHDTEAPAGRAFWEAATAFDVIVPVAIGIALVVFLILVFGGSSTHPA
jgi:hypothetical protein